MKQKFYTQHKAQLIVIAMIFFIGIITFFGYDHLVTLPLERVEFYQNYKGVFPVDVRTLKLENGSTIPVIRIIGSIACNSEYDVAFSTDPTYTDDTLTVGVHFIGTKTLASMRRGSFGCLSIGQNAGLIEIDPNWLVSGRTKKVMIDFVGQRSEFLVARSGETVTLSLSPNVPAANLNKVLSSSTSLDNAGACSDRMGLQYNLCAPTAAH